MTEYYVTYQQAPFGVTDPIILSPQSLLNRILADGGSEEDIYFVQIDCLNPLNNDDVLLIAGAPQVVLYAYGDSDDGAKSEAMCNRGIVPSVLLEPDTQKPCVRIQELPSLEIAAQKKLQEEKAPRSKSQLTETLVYNRSWKFFVILFVIEVGAILVAVLPLYDATCFLYDANPVLHTVIWASVLLLLYAIMIYCILGLLMKMFDKVRKSI